MRGCHVTPGPHREPAYPEVCAAVHGLEISCDYPGSARLAVGCGSGKVHLQVCMGKQWRMCRCWKMVLC